MQIRQSIDEMGTTRSMRARACMHAPLRAVAQLGVSIEGPPCRDRSDWVPARCDRWWVGLLREGSIECVMSDDE